MTTGAVAAIGVVVVVADVVALALTLTWAYGQYPPALQKRAQAVCERILIAIHLLLTLAIFWIGTLVRGQPRPAWLVLALIPIVLLVLHPPIVRAARKYTTGLRVAADIAVAVALITSYAAVVMWPLGLGTARDRWLLFVGGVATLLIGVTVSTVRLPRQVGARSPWYRKRRGSAVPDDVREIAPDAPALNTGPVRNARSNAEAQQTMSRERCRSCGATGYDVETYSLGISRNWYLGRCRGCGDRRDFEFRPAE